MASWIVHLRIADNLLERIEGLDPAAFAIGNIAPDSGIPDENWEHFNPPSEVSHYKKFEGAKWNLADLDFYRQNLQPLKNHNFSQQRFSFFLGYFCHLVTDNLWGEAIYRPTQKRFAREFESDPEFIWEVKRDWYGLDFEYVRSHPDSLFWRVFLDCEYTQDFLDFMPSEAVKQRLEYIKELYQRTDEKIEIHYIKRPGCYLTRSEMDAFIQESADGLDLIYTALWLEGQSLTEVPSALDLNILT